MNDAVLVLAIVLVVLPPLDWLAAGLLVMVSRDHPSILSLRERAVAAVLCAIVATIAGILAWVRLGVFALSSATALLLLAVGLVIVSIPSLYWLVLLATGRFRLDDE